MNYELRITNYFVMRSPIIHFLLLLGLITPLTACDFGGGDVEEAPENTEQQDDDDDDD